MLKLNNLTGSSGQLLTTALTSLSTTTRLAHSSITAVVDALIKTATDTSTISIASNVASVSTQVKLHSIDPTTDVAAVAPSSRETNSLNPSGKTRSSSDASTSTIYKIQGYSTTINVDVPAHVDIMVGRAHSNIANGRAISPRLMPGTSYIFVRFDFLRCRVLS